MAFAFTVEDGTGLVGANALIDLEFARAHHDARGSLSTWDGSSITTLLGAVDAVADTLALAAHPFRTGDGPVRLTTAGVLPAGLAAATDYWVVSASAALIKLATSYANAVAATPVVVDITDAGTGAHSIVYPDFNAQRRAIVEATDYMEQRFGMRYRGIKASSTQALALPRSGAYDKDGYLISGVPEVAKRACAEYSLRAKSAELAPDPGSAADVVSETKTLGPLSKSTTWASSKPVIKEYPTADRWLWPLLLPAGETVRA